MSTSAQIAANRENAQKSTGPRTEEGKAASSKNRLEFGFRSKFSMLVTENADDFFALMRELIAEHKPQTMTERLLVDKLGEHYWLIKRARYLQSTATTPDHIDIKVFALWQRYETQHERGFHKCLDQLAKLRQERRNQEIGFERQKQMQAEAARKQEAHEAKIRLTSAKADEQELETAVKAMMQAPIPGNQTLDLNDLKQAVLTALHSLKTGKTEKIAA